MKKALLSTTVILLSANLLFAQVSVEAMQKKTQKAAKLNRADAGVFLVAENTITHQDYFFVVGQDVSYKTRSYGRFERGVIAGFTDSTISFLNRKAGRVTLPHSTLAALKIPRSRGRKFGGGMLLGLGCASAADGAFVAILSTAFGLEVPDQAVGLGVLGLAAIGGGIALMASKIIDLEGSWRLKAIKVQVNETNNPVAQKMK